MQKNIIFYSTLLLYKFIYEIILTDVEYYLINKLMKAKYNKPYSDETRDKARFLIQKKKKIKEIALELNVSQRTIMRWKYLEKKEGKRYASKDYQRGKKAFLNEKVIFLIIKNNPFVKQKAIAQSYFILTGSSISQASVSKYLRKIIEKKYLKRK